jgi:hypothetical protein
MPDPTTRGCEFAFFAVSSEMIRRRCIDSLTARCRNAVLTSLRT